MTQPSSEMDAAAPAASWDRLLKAARAGDETAIGQMCDGFRTYLLLIASDGLSDQVRSKLSASDIVQESMLEACRDFNSFRGSTTSEFQGWLKRLVAHNLIDSSRRYRMSQRRLVARERSIDSEEITICLPANTRSPSTVIRQQETDEELLRAIAKLPASRRHVVELRHREGMSYADIGDRLGISEVAARKHWSRAIQSLREELATDYDETPPRGAPR